MIGKGKFGRKFSGLLGYISDGKHRREEAMGYFAHSSHTVGPVYYANLSAETPQAAAREMSFIARLSDRVEKPVFHLILSLHPDESKNNDPKRLIEAAGRVVAKLGLSEHQAAYAVHLEKNHMHCHVCVNRVRADGHVWAMWKSAERIKSACRAVEHEMGYTPHAQFQARADGRRAKGLERDSRSQFRSLPKAALTSGDILRPSGWTSRQVRAYEKSGALPTPPAGAGKAERDRIADVFRPAVGPILRKSLSWREAATRLRQRGFEFAVFRNHSRRGLQLVGKDGARVAASAISSEFSLLKLELRWGAVSSCVVEELSMGKAGKAGPERSIAGTAPQLPTQIQQAHRELLDLYRRETAPTVEKRQHLIADAKALESAEVAQLKSAAREEVRELGIPRISREGRAFVRLRIQNDLRDAIQAVHSKYRDKSNSIREEYATPNWIDFVLHKAKRMIQAAITILAWLRGHLDRRKIENKLVASSGLRTPPEPFPHRDFTYHVADTGVVEYHDRLDQLAFVDRGDEIVVVTNEDGLGSWDTMGAALQHADMKWGGCFSRGTPLFRLRAFEVASDKNYRTMLMERFPADTSSSARRITEKEQPGTPAAPVSPPSIAALRRHR